MEAIIFAIVITMAVRYAAQHGHLHWQGSKAANRKSSKGKSIPKRAASAVQHDTGYWAHQVLNGFPEARHALATGWHEGRKAQQQGTQARQQRKTERLEGRAGVIERAREHRRRQREALERIRRARQPEPDEETDGDDEPAREPAPASAGGEGTPKGTSPPASSRNAKLFGEPPRATACAFCSRPLPPDYDGAICPECRQKARERTGQGQRREPGTEGGEGTPPDQQEPPTQPGQGEGDGNVSETTYDSVISRMDQATAEAEQYTAEAGQAKTITEEHANAADQAQQWAQVTSDDMDALGVDSGTRAAMDEHQAALADAKARSDQLNEDAGEVEKAWQKVAETAENVKGLLTSGHGAVKEAHDDAPEGGAEKQFYTAGS